MRAQVVSRGSSVVTVAASAVALWGAVISVASLTGLLHRALPFLIAPLVVAGIVVPSIAYLSSRELQGVVVGIGLRRITLFHAWRIGPALLFFWYGAHGPVAAGVCGAGGVG